MNSLYELDPKWKKLLQLDNFLGGLTVHEFVQGLCQTQSTNGTGRRPGATAVSSSNGLNNNSNSTNSTLGSTTALDNLDPKPYIRTLESTLNELQKLETECSQKTNTLKKQVVHSELEHSEKVLEIIPEFQNLTADFNALDNGLSKVNHVVSPLGSKLEKNIRSKNSYIESVLLIQHYQEFYTLNNQSLQNDLHPSSGHLNGAQNGRNGHIKDDSSQNFDKIPQHFQKFDPSNIVDWKIGAKMATTLKNLLILAHKLETESLPKTVKTSKAIEDFAKNLESQLLENFNESYRANDFKKLNEIALILNYYNDGQNVIQSFIAQHSYLKKHLEMHEQNKDATLIKLDETSAQKISDPDEHTSFYESQITQYLEDLATVIAKESTLVYKVFEDKTHQVMLLFLQTIFQEIINPKIDNLLNVCLSLSNLAYCRMLNTLYSHFQEFLKELQEFFLGIDGGKLASINTILDTCCQAIFNKYILNRSKYFDIEKRSFETILFAKTATFNSLNENKIKQKLLEKDVTTKMASFSNSENNSLSDSANSSTNTGTLTNTAQKKFQSLNTFFKTHLDRSEKTTTDGGIFSNMNATQRANSSTNGAFASPDQTSEFSLSLVDAMLKCFVESLARIMELIPQKCGEYSVELVDLLLSGIVPQYIESALEVAYYDLNKFNFASNSEFTLSSFSIIAKSSEILNLLSISIKTIIIPILNSSPAYKKQVIGMTNGNFKKTEVMINDILEKLVTLCKAKIADSLSKQKKKDYLLKDTDIMDQEATLPVVEITHFLSSIYKNAVSSGFSGVNLSTFLCKIGHDLYLQLLDHYRKFSVNSSGGVAVTKDIIAYQATIEKWGLKESILQDDFATLRELANIFVVQQNLVSSLIKEGHLVDVSPYILGEYIARREDYLNSGVLTRLKISLR
ncbi:hypothetical protein ACO0QE_002662 [Hanseniaspora vineae]